MPITLPPYENDAAFHSRQFQITKPEALTATTSNCVMAHTAVGTKYIWSDVTQGRVPVSADGFSCEEARKKLCQMYGMYLPPTNSSCHDDTHSGAIVGARGRAYLGQAYAAAAGGSTDTGTGCSLTAFVDKGNSPGWYTAGANSSGGAGWGGAAGHHHCDWKSKCCFCTDPPKCKKSGTPPQAPGSCRPDWGTSGYLGGGPYPKTADTSQCPAGTTGVGDNAGGTGTGTGTTATDTTGTAAAPDTSASNIVATLKKNWILVVGAVILLILLSRR